MSEPSLDLSVIIPVYNEEESVKHLLEELHAALDPTGFHFELVLVDDGSTDRTWTLLEGFAASDPALSVIQFRRNFGQTAAMQAGLDAARGSRIVTMDADLQNDPADIPAMLQKLDEGYDLVAGWRKYRKDPFLNRKLPSMIANRLISIATKVKLHDYGCTLKAMTSDVAKELRLYGEMHRFIPAVASWIGARIFEMPVNHRARRYGSSKYGIGRTLRVVLDLITVRFIQSYLTRPMQVFGFGGLLSLGLGGLLCAWLAFEKLAFHARLSDRPLLLLGVLLIVVGLQLVSLGLVADVLSRTYHESQDKKPYYVRARRVGAGSTGALPRVTQSKPPPAQTTPPPPPQRKAQGSPGSS
ncbi:MAG TPA: glycosyltransferase family 2 protein [Polyangiaceae bacterium]|nr:glycosyltransferase family 2 protein [Polyangiaceae bacterium]